MPHVEKDSSFNSLCFVLYYRVIQGSQERQDPWWAQTFKMSRCSSWLLITMCRSNVQDETLNVFV